MESCGDGRSGRVARQNRSIPSASQTPWTRESQPTDAEWSQKSKNIFFKKIFSFFFQNFIFEKSNFLKFLFLIFGQKVVSVTGATWEVLESSDRRESVPYILKHWQKCQISSENHWVRPSEAYDRSRKFWIWPRNRFNMSTSAQQSSIENLKNPRRGK